MAPTENRCVLSKHSSEPNTALGESSVYFCPAYFKFDDIESDIQYPAENLELVAH